MIRRLLKIILALVISAAVFIALTAVVNHINPPDELDRKIGYVLSALLAFIAFSEVVSHR